MAMPNFKIKQLDLIIMYFAFVMPINDPYTGSNVLVVIGTSFQLVHHYFNKMDGIIIKPKLNVKFGYQIGHSPCFVTIEFTTHCKIEAVTHVNYES